MTDQQPPIAYPQPYRVGTALSWAWKHFAAVMIVPTLTYGAVVIGLRVGIDYLAWHVGPGLRALPVDPTEMNDAAARFARRCAFLFGTPHGIVLMVGMILLMVVIAVMQSAYFSGMLDVANGRPVTVGSFFRPRNVGSVVIASVVADVLIGLGLAWCFVGGIIAASLLMFTVVAQLDRNLTPLAAVKASFEIGKANLGKALLALLVIYLVVVVGALAFGVGLLVAIPVTALFLVYTYRSLGSGLVGPPTNGTAIAAVIFALLLPPVGIVLGFRARAQIKRTGDAGRGLATAGLIIGIVLTLVPIAILLTVFLTRT
jgi:uncharacterized membrane protein